MTDLSPLFAWRVDLLASSLPPTCRHVALTLSMHMNDQGGSCFPSVDLLARETGLSRRSVQQNLTKLTDSGWLELERGGGRGRSNRYLAATPQPTDSVQEVHPIEGETVQEIQRIGNAESDTAFLERERVHLATRKGAGGAPEVVSNSPEDVTDSPPTLLDDTASPPATGKPEPTDREVATERFETHLWSNWPRRHGRRVGKAKALKQWLKLTVDQQRKAVRGARAYAAYCQQTNTFPKDAERWLRDHLWEEWLDDDVPDPTPTGVGSAASLPNGGRLTVVPETPEQWAAMGFPTGAAAS